MTREQAIERMNGISALYDQIGYLRRELETLISSELPKTWKDGDTFLLNAATFDIAKNYLNQLYLLEGHSYLEICKMPNIQYVGSNGTLKIKRGV